MEQGYIKLYRKIQENAFYKKSEVVHLFIHLLLCANHKDKKIIWNKEELIIKTGQLITGRKQLSKETGISEQTIRTCLTTLKSTNTITIKSTSKFSLISILNWCNYQSNSTSKLTIKPTNNQPATNQQLTTNNNDKNDKNDKKTSTPLSNQEPDLTGAFAMKLLKHFGIVYKEQYHIVYHSTFKKDVSLLKSLISTYQKQFPPYAENFLLDCIDIFFEVAKTDKWLYDKAKIGTFYTKINEIASKRMKEEQ